MAPSASNSFKADCRSVDRPTSEEVNRCLRANFSSSFSRGLFMAAVRNVYHRRGALGEDFRGRGAERRAKGDASLTVRGTSQVEKRPPLPSSQIGRAHV